MSKYVPVRSVPVGTVAPITKKSSAGSTGKSGTGLIVKSGKTSGALSSGGKGVNVFGSAPKSTKTASVFGSTGKGSTGFESKSKSTTFGSNTKTSSTYGSGGKGSSLPTSKSPSFIPLESSGKNSYNSSGKKPALPVVLGGKTASVFASSPNKNHPSTSFASPKKSKTTFGIIWIPGRKRNKKEYVHVPHRDDGYKERSPSMFPYEHN